MVIPIMYLQVRTPSGSFFAPSRLVGGNNEEDRN